MKLSYLNLTFLVLISCLCTACASGQLTYQLDPELSGIEKLSGAVKRIAVKVSDHQAITNIDDSNTSDISISGPENIAATLTASLHESFKRKNFKIINNHLLADFALEFQLEQLDTQIKKEIFQSTISATSKIRLKANRKSQVFEKIFTNKVTQDVANPVVDSDVTGVMNQLLSAQLSTILNDPQVLSLATQ